LPFLIEILKRSNYLRIALYHFKIEYNFKTQFFFLLGWFIRAFKNFSFFSWYHPLVTNNIDLLIIGLIAITSFSLFFYGMMKFNTGMHLKWFSFLVFFLSFFPFLFNYRFEERYIFFFFPFLCLGWINGIRQLWIRAKRWIFYLIISLLIVTIFKDLSYFYSTPKTGWRNVAKYIKRNFQEKDKIWIFPQFAAMPFYYYFGERDVYPISPSQEPNFKFQNSLWYIFWLNAKFPWIGGKEADEIDSYLKTKLFSIFKHREVKYFSGKKGIIEVLYYRN
jgi:hypothetical protein